MTTEMENFQSGFPESLESVKITMGHQNVNQFSSWTSRWIQLYLGYSVHDTEIPMY